MTTVPMRRNWRSVIFVWFGLPALVLMGSLGAIDLGPALRAAQGKGTPGTFTAVREDCGRSCSFYGDWVSADGSQNREDVILYDEPDSLRVGGTTPAVDTGAREGVFARPGGKTTLLLVSAFTLAGMAAIVTILILLARRLRRRFGRKEVQQGAITQVLRAEERSAPPVP